MNQSLNFVFGLSITKWEPTMGGWYQPFYKQMQGVEIEYCLKECDQVKLKHVEIGLILKLEISESGLCFGIDLHLS